MKTEEYFIKRFGKPKDRHEKKLQKFDSWDMIDFAEQVSREIAVEFELRHVYKGASKAAKKLAYRYFDTWIKNQQ